MTEQFRDEGDPTCGACGHHAAYHPPWWLEWAARWLGGCTMCPYNRVCQRFVEKKR